MLKNKINKHRDIILLTIGSLLVIFSICLLFYDKVELLKNNVFDEVELLKYQDKNKNNVTPKQEEISDETIIDDVEAEDVEEEKTSNNSQKQTNTKTNTVISLFIFSPTYNISYTIITCFIRCKILWIYIFFL